MLSHIIGFSIRNKLVIGLFIAALVGYGTYNFTILPIDAVPDITNNQVQVITVAPSYSATDIERLVTFPIELANSNIHGILEIRSFSRFGLSLVTIVFDDATDIYWARQQVAERLQKVQNEIPKGIGTPELGPISTGLGEIYQYVVRPLPGFESRFDETELRTIQDWIVRRQLLGVPGVAEVSSFGGKLKQYEISVHPSKLQSYNISIADVFTALERNNQNTGGAYIEKGPTVLFIRSEGLIGSKADVENIFIKSTASGTPLFIRDVAEIHTGHATRYGAMCYNDEGEVAGAIVMMLKGANSNDVIRKVKERINQIQTTLPEGVVIEPFLDRTKMVNNAISTVERNLLEGALIVVLILVLFLGSLRAGLLVASVIPLSMLFAVILMNTFGVSGNLMSLGALDFGLIVDGAVIIVEAVMHQLTHSKKFSHVTALSRKEMDGEVQGSASRMMNSAVFGQIIILIVYLPIFALEGIEGKMFKPMAQTVAFALAGAFVLSLTYVPMMSALVLSRKIKHQPNLSDRLMFRLERIYQHSLERVIRWPRTVLLVVLILFTGALFTLSRLGGEFIPELEEGDFAVDTRVLTGSNLSETIKATQEAAGILKSRFPEVEKVVTKIGSGEVPTDPMPMEASDMMVILKPKAEWTSARTFDQLAQKMSAALEDVPGITAGFQYPVQMRFNELMTGARQDVVCKIFGEDLDTLARYAEQLGKVASTVEGSENIYVEPITGLPQIIIRYDREAVAQYRLNIEDINMAVNTAFAGQSSGLVFEGERRFDLVVRLQTDQRKDLEDVQNLLIPTPLGRQIPLYQVAEVSITYGPNQIQREDAKRRIVVGFNVGGRDVQSIVQELQQKVTQQIRLPAGYYITYGGAFENLEAAKQRLSIAVPVSLTLIFILLFFAFSSLRLGLLIYTAIPLSAIGGILFLALRGMPFSISAGIGFIALFGVAVLNGIVLIAEFNRLRKEGMTDLHRVVVMGTKVRLRPVLMTAFVASLGFLPMALSHGAGAEVQRPLATVVIGGLLIATFLTLYVLPILFMMFESSGKKSRHGPKAAVILILLGTGISYGNAQDSLSLPQAITMALEHNLSLEHERLTATYYQQVVRTSGAIPHAQLVAEGGQINSALTDTRFGLSQSLHFPTFYTRQKAWNTEMWKNQLQAVHVSEAELKRVVTRVFYTLLYLEDKEVWLQQDEGRYTRWLKKAEERFRQGESNILETTSAAEQQHEVRLQLEQLRKEILRLRIELQGYLHSEDLPAWISGPSILPFLAMPDTAALRRHPMVAFATGHKTMAEAYTRLEKARRLPDLSIGYFNTSMQGTGADDRTYDAGHRFSSVQLGISVPIFQRAQRHAVEAAMTMEKMADNQYRQQLWRMDQAYGNAISDYRLWQQQVAHYEEASLERARMITETAEHQYVAGDISYFEWMMLIRQARDIQLAYLEARHQLNMSIIELQFLTLN